jgi:hypothetical protein
MLGAAAPSAAARSSAGQEMWTQKEKSGKKMVHARRMIDVVFCIMGNNSITTEPKQD